MEIGLRLDGDVIQVPSESLPSALSKHTSQELRRLTVFPTIRGDAENSRFLSKLNQAKEQGLEVQDLDSQAVGRFSVESSSYSYTGRFQDNSTLYRHTIELCEREVLKVSRLIIAGMPVDPYRYEERLDGDALVIEGRYRLPTETDRQVYDPLRKVLYFPVIREGISPESRSMRWGKTTWSRDGEYTKRSFILVEDCYDQQHKSLSWFEPELQNLMTQVSHLNYLVHGLSNLLAEKGLLESGELAALREITAEKRPVLWDSFFEMDDIDKE